MDENLAKPVTIAIQGLILIFALCLVWFVFVYYPGIVRDKNFLLNFQQPFTNKVVAAGASFPIQTKDYRVTYESASNLYYVFLNGSTVNEYVDNKNAAELVLKNALSVETLCSVKVIYSSTSSLDVPAQYKSAPGCN